MLAQPSASEDELWEALDRIGARHRFEQMPDGLNTVVRERGSRLSAGERQLVSLARAALVDPAVLVLDEATASIDTQTEAIVQSALETLMQGRTAIIIAHRLQTIQSADRIVVLKHGEIREVGRHQELMAAKGIYYTLSQLQFQEVIN